MSDFLVLRKLVLDLGLVLFEAFWDFIGLRVEIIH